MICVAQGNGCCFVLAQYANKGELVLRCSAYVQKKCDVIHCNAAGETGNCVKYAEMMTFRVITAISSQFFLHVLTS